MTHQSAQNEISPEQYRALVNQIAEKIWRLMRREARLDAERRGKQERKTS